MSDELDIPDLVDVSVNSKNKIETTDTNQSLKHENDDFKLIVSKKQRREQSKMDARTSADAAEMDDEYEDIDDEDAELEKSEQSQNDQIQIKKLKFPPISSEKLMVLLRNNQENIC